MDEGITNPNDLSEIESQLAAWRPSAAGLDQGAMLYAAGLAVGQDRRRRRFWPLLCGLLGLCSASALGWGLDQASQRQSLAIELRQARTALAASASSGENPWPRENPAPGALAEKIDQNNYLAERRQMEQDPTRYFASLDVGSAAPVGPAATVGPTAPEPAVLKASQLERLIDQ